MPILGPRARTNPLIAADDWEDQLPRNETRPEMITTPQGKLTWDLYLTGGEGYVGRDGIKSGGIFGLDGQPFIMTPDISAGEGLAGAPTTWRSHPCPLLLSGAPAPNFVPDARRGALARAAGPGAAVREGGDPG